MSISHIKSNTIADWTGTVTVGNSAGGTGTVAATDLVRPGDWNSAHNQYYTLTGNTAGNTTASGTNVHYAGSGAVSVIGSTGSIVWSSPVLRTYEPTPFVGQSTNVVGFGSGTSNPVSLWPFVVQHPLTAGIMDMLWSCSFSTLGNSSGQQTYQVRAGLYSREGTGASSTRLTNFTSTIIGFSVTGNNSSYTISQATATGYAGYTLSTTGSGGSNITSAYTGLKKVGVPINSYLSPGQYWLGLMATASTSSIIVGVSVSYFGPVVATEATAMGPIGSYSSDYSVGSDPNGGRWREGYGQWSTAGNTGLPVSIAFAAISASNNSVIPHMRFWST